MSQSEWTPRIDFYELRITRSGNVRKYGRMDITDDVLTLAKACLSGRGRRKR